MSRTLKCDKMCKYVKVSDKIFKNTTETKLKTIKEIKNRPKQLILRGWNRIRWSLCRVGFSSLIKKKHFKTKAIKLALALFLKF